MAEGGEDKLPTGDNTPVTGSHTEESDEGQKTSGSERVNPPTPKGPASEAEKKGFMLMEQADAKVHSASGFFGKLFSGTTKLEDAADLYVRAANQFKVAKSFENAGKAFTEAAQLHESKLDSRHEAANNYAEAAQVYKKVSPQEAVDCYRRSISIYSDMGRFSLSARYYSNVGEIFESELVDIDQAIESYEQAADFYKGEDSNASANKCLTKVAHMSAQQQNFDKAANLFEEIGKGCLDNNLLKYSAKDYFFKALVCWFCKDKEIVTVKMEEYKALHPALDGTRELKLIENLLEAIDEEDKDKFTELIQDYDAISRIDHWLTAQLLHIKKSMDISPDVN